MADKEATVYIIDLGRSMRERNGGRPQSDLDWSMTYVWDKITATVATERKTATIGFVGLRTDGTKNEMGSEEAFRNISVLQEIGQLLLPGLKDLRAKIEPSRTNNGDAISAIVVAIQMITKYCRKNKWRKQICLVTNGKGSMDADDVGEITSKLKEDEVELVVIGVDFDDLDYGFKEEAKDDAKAENEAALKDLVDKADGIFGTMQQATDELGLPRLKSVRPTPSYKGYLTLGNPDESETAVCIDVQRYPRVMIRRPLTASSFVERSETEGRHGTEESPLTLLQDTEAYQTANSAPDGLTGVKSQRTYQVQDEKNPGHKIDVKNEELARGYEYGRTAVHISDLDFNVTKLETKQSLDIIGFIPWAKYERYMNMSVSCVTIATRTNNKAIMALSSFIHALFELENYAVARLVTKDGKDPLVVLLAPSIEADYECLLDVQLPFAEDIRSYKFPPLDRVVTISGKEIRVHRNLPNEKLQDAMSEYVDSMDLAKFGRDDDGNATEYAQMTDTYSPALHRIDQAVRWRAIHPDEPVPPPYEILIRYSKPPEALVERSKRQLEDLVNAADVKKVPPKAQSRKRARNEVKPMSGLDVNALLTRPSGSSNSNNEAKDTKKPKPQITHTNPIPEFRQALDQTSSVADIRDAATRLGIIIEEQIRDSLGDLNYARAIAEMNIMREEMLDMEEPECWNGFLKGLKGKILKGELGGDRDEMWGLMQKERVKLIGKGESGVSEVTDEQAKEFLYSK